MRSLLEDASTLLVDGNNVMGARPDGWWRDRAAASRRLVADLTDLAAATGQRIVVVFDGTAPRSPADGTPDGRVTVRYAERGGPDAADDVIAALAAAADDRAGLLVVTADRGLRERVTAAGVDVVGPRALLTAVDALRRT